MASTVPTSGCNEMRINLLRLFRSKVYSTELEAYYNRFDLPQAFMLSTLERSEAVYHHGSDRVSLYLKHLEYGLRLSLHPFMRQVFEALEVSPVQIKPNSIATLVGFVMICHRVGIQPIPHILGHLVSIKMAKKEGHFCFQNLGGFKLISNAPDSNKDWKERFMWVFGADAILSCPTRLEIKRDVLKLSLLTNEERQGVNKIRAYAGSQEMSNLFESASSGRHIPRPADRGRHHPCCSLGSSTKGVRGCVAGVSCKAPKTFEGRVGPRRG